MLSGAFVEPRRNLFQQTIAGLMTVGVVDVLQSIQIDEYGGDLLALRAFRDCLVDCRHRHRSIGQAGKIVVRRAVPGLRFFSFDFLNASARDHKKDDHRPANQSQHHEHNGIDACFRLISKLARHPTQCADDVAGGVENRYRPRPGRSGVYEPEIVDLIVRSEIGDGRLIESLADNQQPGRGWAWFIVVGKRYDRPDRDFGQTPSCIQNPGANFIRLAVAWHGVDQFGEFLAIYRCRAFGQALVEMISDNVEAGFIDQEKGVEEDTRDRAGDIAVLEKLLVDLAVQFADRIVPNRIVLMGLPQPAERHLDRRFGRPGRKTVLYPIDLIGHLAKRHDNNRQRADEDDDGGEHDAYPEAGNEFFKLRHLPFVRGFKRFQYAPPARSTWQP